MSTPEATRKFQFIREIASGGFGSVYLAKVIHPDGFTRLSAIKLLHPKWSENDEITKRMRDEARLLGWLRHKHIVDVLDLTRIDGRCAVIMEYLEAVDAKVVIQAHADSQQLVPLRVALEVCAAVASALDAAYNRPPYPGERPLHVIHRDIKPSNIMVDGSGTVKVLDFGVARSEFDAREAKTQEMSFGSLEYMPPERLFFEPESPSSDVYSLGATLYEMLALERLGKARLRQADQEKFVEERFEDLIDKHPLPGEQIEDVLHDLLWDMLAFDEADRPSAADCVTRMRSFARRLQEEGLEEWSERTIPSLVRKHQAGVRGGEGAALVDQTVTEDTSGFGEGFARGPSAPGGLGPAIVPPAVVAPKSAVPVARRGGPTPSVPGARSRLQAQPAQSPDEAGTLVLNRPPLSIAPTAVPTLPELDLDEDLVDPTIRFQSPHDLEDEVGTLEEPAPLRPGPGADGSPPPAPTPTELPPRPSDLDGWEDTDAGNAPPPTASARPVGRTVAPRESLAGRASSRTPVAPPAPEPEPAPRTPAVFVAGMVGMTLAVLALSFGGVGLVGMLGIGTYKYLEDGPSSVQGEVPPEPAAPAPAPAAPPAFTPGEGTHFVSRLEGTRKVSARCDAISGEGQSSALVLGTGLGTCTVTAMDGARHRLTAVVTAVEPREYVCFASGEGRCE